MSGPDTISRLGQASDLRLVHTFSWNPQERCIEEKKDADMKQTTKTIPMVSRCFELTGN